MGLGRRGGQPGVLPSKECMDHDWPRQWQSSTSQRGDLKQVSGQVDGFKEGKEGQMRPHCEKEHLFRT